MANPYDGNPYGAPPPEGGGNPYGGGAPAEKADGFIYGGYAFAVLSVLCLPIIFGPLGILMGYLAKGKGDSRGQMVMIVSGVCMVLGFIFGAALFLLS